MNFVEDKLTLTIINCNLTATKHEILICISLVLSFFLNKSRDGKKKRKGAITFEEMNNFLSK